MIVRIRGTLTQIDSHGAIVTPEGSGISHEVLLPCYLAERLAGRSGQAVELVTIEYLESHAQGSSFIPRLVGFASQREREFFSLFTTVKGLGNRKVLRAMTREPAEIARAIAARDHRALQALPEIGKRLAETIVAELHGKVEAFLTPGELESLDAHSELKPLNAGADTPAGEAIATLMALGESRYDAEELVRRAQQRGSEGDTAEALVSAALGMRG